MEIDRTGLDSRIFDAFSRTSERRYLYLCNMKTNVSRWSKGAVDYFGLPEEYMWNAGEIWMDYIHPDDRAAYKKDIEDVFEGRKALHELEYRARNKEGNYVICTCRGLIVRGTNGEPDMFAGTLTNHGILDNVDAATHLYNIYEFQSEIHRLMDARQEAMIMIIGINHFRTVNDLYGYTYGNKVLRSFASLLTDFTCSRGMVYRMDGPNFALRIRNMDQPEAKKLYEQIRELGRNSVIVDGRHVALRISGGAMVLDEKSIQGNSVRACVTYAQEKSKHDYHSELVFFDNEREGRDLRQMEKIEFIRKCVLDGCRGFYMCYQPLVQAQTGKVAGMEALLRWSQPPYGDLLPGEFIQWLERDDCFFELGNWILRQSMIDALEFVRNQPEFIVNVNVSYTQIEREDFRDAVMGIIEEVHFPPENLCLELTERTRPLDQDYLLNVLEFFRSRGIKIALDDFGTGSASLNLLRKLPITCLKIDRMFISNIRSNPTDEIIVETLIESAKKLGMTVCVEGVENASLRDYLSKFNVNTHQGFFYSKPVRIEKFREFIPEGFAVS